MSAKLEQLVDMRSSLVEEVLTYLDTLAEKAALLPKYYPPRLRSDELGKTGFDDLRQMVQVVEDRTAYDRWLAEERERLRATGYDIDRLAYDPIKARPETEGDELELALRDRPTPPPPPLSWDEHAGERFRRAVILGDPGFGKTWLLRYEARRIARTAAEQLRDRTIRLNEAVLPIFARLSDVNRKDGPLEETLVVLVGKRRSQNFCRFVRRKFETDRCTILLDAWDEAQPQQDLRQRIEGFSRGFPHPRILLTSRIIGYDIARPPIPGAKELELLAFDRPQTESFVSVWFGHDNETAKQFLATLNQHHQVRGLARIPLVLSLMCRAYQQEKLTFPTRRIDLYERCLRGLLRDWMTIARKPKAGGISARIRFSNSYVDALLEFLRDVALALFAESYEQFDEIVLRKKMLPWLDALKPSHELYGRNAADIIDELKEDGLLIAIGEDRDAPLLFLHRTFQEYLAAGAIASRINEQGWDSTLFLAQRQWILRELVDKKAWHPTWEEVIILMAGQLSDPIPLLEMLRNPKPTTTNPTGDDIFRHRLCLAARCLPEISCQGPHT